MQMNVRLREMVSGTGQLLSIFRNLVDREWVCNRFGNKKSGYSFEGSEKEYSYKFDTQTKELKDSDGDIINHRNL